MAISSGPPDAHSLQLSSHRSSNYPGFLEPSRRLASAPLRGDNRIVCFTLDTHLCGVWLDVVERVLPAMELVPLPNAPAIVIGVFNLEGRIIPAFDLRRRFGLPERELAVTDHFIVARARGLSVAIVVDDNHGLVPCDPEHLTNVDSILPGLPLVRGVLRHADALILVHDLGDFLSLEDARQLDVALQGSLHP